MVLTVLAVNAKRRDLGGAQGAQDEVAVEAVNVPTKNNLTQTKPSGQILFSSGETLMSG